MAINIVAMILRRAHAQFYLMPLVALIVGLHFYPLAYLFQVPPYRFAAVSMSSAGIVGIAILVSGGPTAPATAAVEAICAIALWATAFFVWQSASPTPVTRQF